MPANIQVTANTSSAVNAFNALTAAIAGSNAQIQNLNVTINQGNNSNIQYGNNLKNVVGGAFQQLTSLAGSLFGALTRVGSAMEFLLNSIVKELDKLQGFNAMMSVTTKSTTEAASQYEFLRRTADRLGVQFDALLNNYAKLIAAIPDGNNKLKIAETTFLGLSMAARTLHASNQDTQLMFYAVTQMASKGVVSMEELRRQLGQKLPGTIQIAARAVGMSVADMEKAIAQGVVDSTKFLDFFGSELIRTFADSSEIASTSVSASINRLHNVWVDFVKSILDSGAGKSIIGVFDAIREKLSDPYVIARFSEMIMHLADRFTGFIQNLTSDDIRNGFDTMTHFVEMLTTALGGLITAVTWLMDHSALAGAAVGGLAGAAAGAPLGPYGMAGGAILGAGAGGYMGYRMGSSASDEMDRKFADMMARQTADEQARAADAFKYNQIIPMLQNFKGLNSMDGLERLMSAEMANTKTILDLNAILTSKNFKSESERADAVRSYAQTGELLTPRGHGLQDIIGGTPKLTAAQKSENATYERALGLDANFPTELKNLNNLLSEGRLNQDKYAEALQNLINKQPYMVKYLHEQKVAQDLYNKGLEESIDMAIRQVEVKEKVKQELADELHVAGMRQEDLQVENELLKYKNMYEKEGLIVSKDQLQVWREQIQAKNQLNELTRIGEQITAQTIDRYGPKIKEQKAMQLLTNDPTSGFTAQDRTDFTVNSDPNMKGSQQWMDAQQRQLLDYYAFIDGLRKQDVIKEETAEQAKAQAALQYNNLKLQQTTDFFSTLAGLSTSGNKRLADIGKRAAIVEATIKGYQAVQEALAAPPGWPYNAANVFAVGLLQAANVAKIAGVSGFEEGGYTGNGGRSQIAGVVHGQEYVVNADATARNRSALEAMNRGATFGGSGGSNVKVVVNNNADGTVASTRERDTADGREIEVVIEKVVSQQIASGGRIATSMERQYGLNRSRGVTR